MRLWLGASPSSRFAVVTTIRRFTNTFKVTAALALVLGGSGARAGAQEFVPVNIYVADVTYDGATVKIGTPRKLTGDRGINSQPAFTPDGRAILFVSRRDSANAQSDIYRIDLSTGAETRVTSTPEMENSPTVTPDGKLMVIRWTPATLFTEWGPWVYEMDGRPAKGVLPGPDTVGYYARVDSVTFAMMRPKSRPAMAIFDARTGTMTDFDWPVANLPPQLIPGKPGITYTRTDSAGRNVIRKLDLLTRDTSRVFPALVGRVVHVWTPGGALLMGKGNVVYSVRPGNDYAVWQPVKKFSEPGLQSVTTYAMSPRGDKLVILSPVKPALHTVIRDSLQVGRTVSQALASLPRIPTSRTGCRHTGAPRSRASRRGPWPRTAPPRAR